MKMGFCEMRQYISELVVELFMSDWNKKCESLLKKILEAYPSVRDIKCHKGEIVYRADNSVIDVFLLIEGYCHIISTSSFGVNTTLFINKAPIEFGLLEALIGREEYSASLIAASESCRVIKIPKDLFLASIKESTPALLVLIKSQAQAMEYNLNMNLRRNILSRKEQLILYLYENAVLNEIPYKFAIDRLNLSNILGINLRTLFRYTDTLVSAGALSKAKGKLVVTAKNLEVLSRIANDIYDIF